MFNSSRTLFIHTRTEKGELTDRAVLVMEKNKDHTNLKADWAK